MRYQSRLTAVPMWSATHPGLAVAVWTLCVAAATVVGGFGPHTGFGAHTVLDGPPALLLAALLVCGTVGAAVVLAVVAAGTGVAAAGLCSAVHPADGPLVGGAAAGLAIVYAAALLRRFRTERANSRRYAGRVTISTTGGIVVAAGLVVVLPAALFAGLNASFAALVATGTALCAAGTVIPALLAWYGGPVRARPNRVASFVGRLSVRHPAPSLALAAVLLAVAVAALRIAGIPFLATIPGLITLPVPVLLLAGRMRAATLTGSALGPAIEWAVLSTAPTTVIAAAGAGCVAAVADLAAGVGVLVGSVLVVLTVPALLAVAGGSAQSTVSGPSAPPAKLKSADDGDDGDGGGVPWRK